jgi:hypothetical protein
MKKEYLQNSQQRTGSITNTDHSRDEEKNPTTNISNEQNDGSPQAGLGRDRMTDIEDLGEISGREDYAGDDEDLKNENLNAANDQ